MRAMLLRSIMLATGLAIAPGAAADVVVHVGTLLAVPGQAPLTEQTIVVSDGTIASVESGYRSPQDGDRLIDLKDNYVVPGLIDLHVHLLLDFGRPRSVAMTESDTLTVFFGGANARKTLRAGFTIVRDLGGTPEAIYALRDAIAAGYVPGPRIFASGSSVAATGGHGDVDGMRADLMELATRPTICDGPTDCRRATRHAIKYGADWIKITATGGVLSDTATGLGQQMTDDELVEIMQTAHSLGTKVAAHAHGADGINAAIRAGVDTIDHGTFLDRESVRLFKRHDAYLVPTMMPGYLLPGLIGSNPNFTPAILEKTRLAAEKSKAGVALAYENGVKIAFGTDTGVTPHGDNATEFKLMVEAGMSPMDAIHSATVVAAEVLEIADTAGTIEPGKVADMVVLNGDPIADIEELQRVAMVIKDGEVVE